MKVIKNYQLTSSWRATGTAQWNHAVTKDGKEWFIKQFLKPTYVEPGEGITESLLRVSHERCAAFRKEKEMLYSRIRAADTGNVVGVTDFFLHGSHFYAVSPWVPAADIKAEQVASLPESERLLLLRILCHCVKSIHGHGVVHADLKPDNIIIKQTATGGLTMKLIDFEASFPEEFPPDGEHIVFDAVFVAPETLISLAGEPFPLSTKLDIFALGLLFHLYYTGALPQIPSDCQYAAEVALKGREIQLSSTLPEGLKTLIERMLNVDPDERPDSAEVFEYLRLKIDTSSNSSSLLLPPPPL